MHTYIPTHSILLISHWDSILNYHHFLTLFHTYIEYGYQQRLGIEANRWKGSLVLDNAIVCQYLHCVSLPNFNNKVLDNVTSSYLLLCTTFKLCCIYNYFLQLLHLSYHKVPQILLIALRYHQDLRDLMIQHSQTNDHYHL